jgi:CheY-like chemotaxis protein
MGLSPTHSMVAHSGGFIVASTAPVNPAHPREGDSSQDPRHDAGCDFHPEAPRVSSFHVFLPYAAALSQNSIARGASGPGGEVILLVEDEPLIRELSRDMLERQGYRVLLASNAKEAEQIGGSAGSFDLLITAEVMPNTTGAELASKLRTSHPGLKVLYISSYTDDRTEREESGTGDAVYLRKPFSADSLGRKIRQALSRT